MQELLAVGLEQELFAVGPEQAPWWEVAASP